VGARLSALAYRVWEELMDELGLLMATAEKRQCGQHLQWNGTGIASQLGFGWIAKAKLLSSISAILSCLDGTITFSEYHSLLGLLEHFTFSSSLRRNRMYGLWHPFRQKTTPEPDTIIRPTVLMRKQLNRWLTFLRSNAGVSALKAIPKSVAVRASNGISLGTVFTATSDAATDKVTAGLGAWCHGLWWSYKCSAAEALIPIVVLEFIAALVTFFTFAPLLGDPAATKHKFHLRIDALSSPQVLADDCAHAAVLEALHLAVSCTKLWQQWAPHMVVSHLHGIGNEFADAASRADLERLARLAAQVKASPKEKQPGPMLAALLATATRTLSEEEMHISETQANNATKASHAMHNGASPQPRPLTTTEMDLALGQANTPTSASYVGFSSVACSILLGEPGAARMNRAPPTKPQRKPVLAKHAYDLKQARGLSACAVLLHQQLHQPAAVHSASQPTPSPKARNAHWRPQKCQPSCHAPVTRDGNWSSSSRFKPEYSLKPKQLSYIRYKLNKVRTLGRNKRTVKGERGHWAKWLKFCMEHSIDPWRDDADANSGRDQAGYQEEIDIICAFVQQVLSEMREGGRGRPAPLPSSAMNVFRGIRRVHAKQSPPIYMIPTKAVNDTLAGLNEQYKQRYGFRMLLPRRKEPWRRKWVTAISKARHNTSLKLAGRQVDQSLFFTSWFALWDTLCQTGFRKAEIAVAREGDFAWHEHLTRASLLWRIKGVTHADPSEALLRTAGESDCAILTPACSKTDSHGVIWGDKPIYLPIRFGADYCAALSLMQLETRFPLHGRTRARQPLFQMGAGKPFTFYCLSKVLDDLKDTFLPVDVNHNLFTYHSCRIYLATSLGSDKSVTPEQIQAICRWQSAKSLGIYNRMQPHQYVTLLDRANSAVITSYTAANLPCIDSYEGV
jgi:hypothetical protein